MLALFCQVPPFGELRNQDVLLFLVGVSKSNFQRNFLIRCLVLKMGGYLPVFLFSDQGGSPGPPPKEFVESSSHSGHRMTLASSFRFASLPAQNKSIRDPIRSEAVLRWAREASSRRSGTSSRNTACPRPKIARPCPALASRRSAGLRCGIDV